MIHKICGEKILKNNVYYSCGCTFWNKEELGIDEDVMIDG